MKADATSQFDPLPDGMLEKQLDQWVDSFPVDSIRQHLADLEQKKGTIEAAIESLNRRLRIWQTMRAHSAGGISAPEVRPSKRDAVLSILERDPTREFALAELRQMMLDGGLLDDTQKGRHALEATVSNMCKRGEIERPRKGYYTLPQTQTLTPHTSLHCQEDKAA
jgi:hypothetical protein